MNLSYVRKQLLKKEIYLFFLLLAIKSSSDDFHWLLNSLLSVSHQRSAFSNKQISFKVPKKHSTIFDNIILSCY